MSFYPAGVARGQDGTPALSGSASLNFPSIAANATSTLTITVTGATVGRPVALGPPAAIESGLSWCGYVSAADTVTIRLRNTTGSAIDPASGTWTALVFTS